MGSILKQFMLEHFIFPASRGKATLAWQETGSQWLLPVSDHPELRCDRGP